LAFQLVTDWNSKIVFSEQGPQPQAIYDDDQFKVLLAGLEAGQAIPPHPEGRSMYHFLEGSGVMTVDGVPVAVQAGTTLVPNYGAVRGLLASERLVFLAARVVISQK
jgi:quercetin dioxygenase-like cupin family protein